VLSLAQRFEELTKNKSKLIHKASSLSPGVNVRTTANQRSLILLLALYQIIFVLTNLISRMFGVIIAIS
jgi:hypothetical protein